jgi:hypothetical protein
MLNNPLPNGMFGKEKPESCNKIYKKYREHHARKTSWQANLLDVFRRRMDSTDPVIASWRLSLKRQELRLLVSVVTEHCTLNNHMKTMRLANSPRCAKYLEEDERVEHFLCVDARSSLGLDVEHWVISNYATMC